MTTIKNSNCGLMNYNITKSKQINFTPVKANLLKLPDLLLPEPYLTARYNDKMKVKYGSAREWEKLINGEWQIIDGKTIWINDFYYH